LRLLPLSRSARTSEISVKNNFKKELVDMRMAKSICTDGVQFGGGLDKKKASIQTKKNTLSSSKRFYSTINAIQLGQHCNFLR